jgi:PAS domain S-box-containing protein
MEPNRPAWPDPTRRPRGSRQQLQTAELATREEQPVCPLSLDDLRIGQLFWEIRDAVAVIDAESGRIVHWNPAAEGLFGIKAPDAIGQSLDIFLPEIRRARQQPNAGASESAVFEGLLQVGQPIKTWTSANTGRSLPVEFTLSAVTADHAPGRFALAIIRDATARKAAAADELRLARERASREAAEAEAARQAEAVALLEFLLAAAPEGFALFDLELRFARVNSSYAKINDTHVSAHLGRTLHEVAPAIAAVHEPLIRHVLVSGETVRDLEISESRYAALQDQRHWLVSYYPVEDQTGKRFGVGAVVIDITARKRLEQLKQDLLDGVSHDLNSPLAALHLRAQLLRRRAAQEDSPALKWMQDGASQIEELTARLAGMVSEMAGVGRLRLGQSLELAHARTDLIALVRCAVDEQQLSTDRHRFTVHAATVNLFGTWDASHIHRAIANLLGNAVKYSPDGGPVAVEVDEVNAGSESWAVITIRDQGLGIPAADLPHIFEHRYRGSNVAGTIAGDGIGLAGALQIVQQHGGTITVVSRECVGSFFEVRLPLDASTEPAQPKPS